MSIGLAAPAEREELRELVDRALRRPDAQSHVWQDFPLALGDDNAAGLYVLQRDGRVAGGLAVLVRTFRTSAGDWPVAAIGGVVTRLEERGRGVSRRLQERVLDDLRAQGVPLAVLWSDQPEVYAGRGFAPAGVEYHVDLARWRGAGVPRSACLVRPYAGRDVAAVTALYGAHPLRTLRRPGDGATLYAMPGTRGVVLEDGGGTIGAYVFCGKGSDFVDHVLEWGGPVPAVLQILEHVRRAGLARHVLVPQGGEALLEALVARGAGWRVQPSGLWCILDERELARRAGAARRHFQDRHGRAPGGVRDWLGTASGAGRIVDGVAKVAVWGFDSA